MKKIFVFIILLSFSASAYCLKLPVKKASGRVAKSKTKIVSVEAFDKVKTITSSVNGRTFMFAWRRNPQTKNDAKAKAKFGTVLYYLEVTATNEGDIRTLRGNKANYTTVKLYDKDNFILRSESLPYRNKLPNGIRFEGNMNVDPVLMDKTDHIVCE